jgi:NADH dehydrogenase
VHIVQSQSHILNTYDQKISNYAERKFKKDEIDVITNARVSKVEKDKIHYQTKNLDTGEITEHSLPAGLILWSTGVTLNPFTAHVREQLANVQKNRHALETDSHLRVLGAPLGDVYAVGDCATVQNNTAAHIVDFLRAADLADGKDPETTELTFDDWRRVAGTIRRKYPQAANHLKRLDELFYESDRDGSGTLDYKELEVLLKIIDSKLTSLPATAQRAHQQG